MMQVGLTSEFPDVYNKEWRCGDMSVCVLCCPEQLQEAAVEQLARQSLDSRTLRCAQHLQPSCLND